ncbi:MAG: hypothetical protein KDH89_11690 [Anaerolineae bacterium]|nr:hypothetical protein [Anaerolineae bacterium]
MQPTKKAVWAGLTENVLSLTVGSTTVVALVDTLYKPPLLASLYPRGQRLSMCSKPATNRPVSSVDDSVQWV